MSRRRRSRPHVALIIESSLEYGRGLLRGITRYLREHGPWSIFLEQRELGAALPRWIREWDDDGIITRSDDPQAAIAGLQQAIGSAPRTMPVRTPEFARTTLIDGGR